MTVLARSTRRELSKSLRFGFSLLVWSWLVNTPSYAQEGFVQAHPRSGNPAPSFPERAQEASVAGDVVFQLRLSPEGTVDSVRIVSVPTSDLGFEEAVESTVRNWRFDPARNNGVAIAATYVGRIAFNLDAKAEKSLRDLVTTTIRHLESQDVEAVSALFDDELGHTHTGEGMILGPREASSMLAEMLGRDGVSVSVDSFKYFGADLVNVKATLMSTSGAVQEAETYAVKKGADWQLAHLTLEPRWQDIDRDRVDVPKKSRDRAPIYPEQAKRAGIQGMVVVEAVTNREGRVTEVLALSTAPLLTESMKTAAKAWRYAPLKLDDQPISMYVIAVGRFTLEGSHGYIRIEELLGATEP